MSAVRKKCSKCGMMFTTTLHTCPCGGNMVELLEDTADAIITGGGCCDLGGCDGDSCDCGD